MAFILANFSAWLAEHPKNTIVKGVVTEVDARSATVDLGEGVLGTLRASELARGRVEDARTVLRVGEEVEAKFTNKELSELGVLEDCEALVDSAQLPAEVTGKRKFLQATIENQGPVGTPLVNIDIRMRIDGVECDTGIVIAGLGAGARDLLGFRASIS